MLASLKSVGTVPVENEVLKRISNGFEITDFRSLSMSMGILKGPTAFPHLRLDIMFSISVVVVGEIKKLSLCGKRRYSSGLLLTLGISFSSLLPTLAK